VLVVNDDPDGCELIARILESAGWAATRSHSQDEAMTALVGDRRGFTATVVDISAGGTGASLDFLKDVRSRDEIQDHPVVLLTQGPQRRAEAWLAGVDGFLARPFHADELVSELYALFTRTSDEREQFRTEQLDARD
jgi:two-component system, OmpR family, response regulator PhoP